MSDTPEASQETFISHLIELRSRLLRSIIAVFIVLAALFPFAKDIYAALQEILHVWHSFGSHQRIIIIVPSVGY